MQSHPLALSSGHPCNLTYFQCLFLCFCCLDCPLSPTFLCLSLRARLGFPPPHKVFLDAQLVLPVSPCSTILQSLPAFIDTLIASPPPPIPFDCVLPEGRDHPPGLQPQCPEQYLEQKKVKQNHKLLLLKPGSSSIPWPQPEIPSHPKYLLLPQSLHPIHVEPSFLAPNMYVLNIHISFPPYLPPKLCHHLCGPLSQPTNWYLWPLLQHSLHTEKEKKKKKSESLGLPWWPSG